MKPDFQLPIEEVQAKYQIKELEEGLNEKQVLNNRKEYGRNVLQSQTTPKWKLLARQFNNMIIYILLFAAFLTLLMGHRSDAIIIFLVVIINALIGYYQEASASNALEKIKQLLSSEATVYREGMRIDIPTEDLVVGDVVFLEAGDNVPADLRIIEADNLRIQESSLTGEADSVEKEIEAIKASQTP